MKCLISPNSGINHAQLSIQCHITSSNAFSDLHNSRLTLTSLTIRRDETATIY